MEKQLAKLKSLLQEIDDLQSARLVLSWDKNTYMPVGGASARAQQMATLGKLIQDRKANPALGRLLDQLETYTENLPYEDDLTSLIRVARHDYERAIRVPPDFMAQINLHSAESYQVWVKARPENNYAAVQPYLEKTLDLSREYARYFPGYEHIADPLIDRADQDMTVATIRPLFAELRQQLVPMIQTIVAQTPVDVSCLHAYFSEEEQLAFGLSVVERFGYDLRRGRQDKTPHPFMTVFSIDDVRITTRVDPYRLDEALFSTLHEAGHALYQLGVNKAYERTPLKWGASSGVHESQSRLWENLVGRSHAFWEHYYPQLQALFPEQLGTVTLDHFYRAINKVVPSLIRTDADEVTYNLHVMIRFDLELALLEGQLSVKDLPQAWRARYESDLGCPVPDDRDGVLQDVHWFSGFTGGQFQGYTLGNIMGALFFEEAIKTHPQIPEEISRGQFTTLHGWLIEHIYQHGKKFTADDLVQQVSGGPLKIEPYIRYLRNKYGELYVI